MRTKEEAIAFLKDLMTDINTQDNRITATPYYYDLRSPDVEGDGYPREKCVAYGQNIFFTEKAAQAYIKSEAHNLPEGTYNFLCYARRNPELLQLLQAIGIVAGVPYERK